MHPGAPDPATADRLAAADRLAVAVLADTHRPAARAGDLPDEVWALCAEADVIVHAGDITDLAVLAALADHAPVLAVLGNNDRGLADVLPERLSVVLAGVRVGVVHDSGPARGRAGRLHAAFADADVVIFGHSHIPWDEEGVGGQRLLNPGSPTQRRRQPVATCGRLGLAGRSVTGWDLVPIDPGRALSERSRPPGG